jgi:hypothetical protein
MTARLADPPVAPRSLSKTCWRGRAFALDVDSPKPLVGVPPAADQESPRRTRVEFLATDEFDSHWSSRNAVRLFQLSFVDGKPMMTVDHHATRGYRIWAPHHGRHLVAPDGQTIFSAPPTRRGWWWQRLFSAQVLPLAATLQGLELMHASAVAFGGRAVAITAGSGSGKTSLAAHLLDLEGDLVTDDVLALEVVAGRVLAHPGVGLVNIDPAEREALGPRAASQLGHSLGGGQKVYAVAPVVDRPLPLAAVYHLRRGRQFRTLRISEADALPRALLGSSFITYLESPARLVTHFEVFGRIAETIPSFVVEAPLVGSASELAQLVRSHGEGIW